MTKLTDSQKRLLKFIDVRILRYGSCHLYTVQQHGFKFKLIEKLCDLGLIEYDGREIVLTDAALPYLDPIE